MRILDLFREGFIGLKTSFLQWGINRISDRVFRLKKAEAIGLCEQYKAKYYVIQAGYFQWNVIRAGDIDLYKRIGSVDKNVTAIGLRKLAAFTADPSCLVRGKYVEPYATAPVEQEAPEKEDNLKK